MLTRSYRGLAVDADMTAPAERMVELARQPELRRIMGAAAREKIAREFNIHDTIDNLRRIIGLAGAVNTEEETPHCGAPRCWDHLRARQPLRLYAGDVPSMAEYDGWIGLSLTNEDHRHLRHDITLPVPLPDNSVDSFQAEDVLEHITYDRLGPVIDEIFRILKPGGLFRLSVPDYGCDVLRQRSELDLSGEPVFDPGGNGTPAKPGHVWFPRIENVYRLLERSLFHSKGHIDFLHYWNMDNLTHVTRPIDYTKGFVHRTPDFDQRVKHPYRPMSMVVDLIKEESAQADPKNCSRL